MPFRGISRSRTVLQGTVLNQDVNADAFILAASITDSTQKAAITTFVKDLKAINAVQADFVNFDTPANSICLAIYPFVGGSAAKHKFNLINPADTDTAHRLTFGGVFTHDEKGVKGSDSGYISAHLNSNTLGATSHGLDVLLNGYTETGPKWCIINAAIDLYIQSGKHNVQSNGQNLAISRTNEYSSSGLVNLNRRSQAIGDFEGYFSNVKKASVALATANLGAGDISLMSYGNGYYCNTLMSFASIRKAGVSEAVIRLFNAAILKFQNTLGRLQKKNIVFEGHSFFHNQGTPNVTGWLVEQTVAKLNEVYANRIFRYVASAISGSTIQDVINRKATAVDPYYITDFGMKNIIPLWIGTNDVTATAGSGATAYAAYKALYNSYVASGWTVIAITMTELLSGTGQREAERVIFNNLIRTDLVPQYLIDTDLIPELADSDNTTYFNADKIHLLSAANNLISTALANMIATI